MTIVQSTQMSREPMTVRVIHSAMCAGYHMVSEIPRAQRFGSPELPAPIAEYHLHAMHHEIATKAAARAARAMPELLG